MIEAAEAKRLITAKEFAEMPESKHAELVKGEIVSMAPSVSKHGALTSEIHYRVRQFIEASDISAYTTVEGTGYALFRNPDTIRAPDIGVLLKSTYSGGVNDDYFPVAPDIAIEIVSKNDRAGEIQDKVNEYLQAGTRLVWVVYPSSRLVVVHTPQGAHTLQTESVLDGGDILPGFTLAVDALFAPLNG